jgi:hypothetical protein
MNQSNKKPLSADQFGTLTQEILSLEKKQVEAREMRVFLVKNEEEEERLERRNERIAEIRSLLRNP